MRPYTVEVILRVGIVASSPEMAQERTDRIISDAKLKGLLKQGWSSTTVFERRGSK